MASTIKSNGYSDLPSMQPRAFKTCSCGVKLAPSQQYCANCTQTNKGMTADAKITPTDLDPKSSN